MRVFIAFLAVGLCLFAGCLKFGNDSEVLAPNVTAQHLQQITTLTSIRFPEGSTGLAYFYSGSGIDDGLAAKVVIPTNTKDAFLQNEIFRKGSTNNPTVQIGRSKAWWKIDALKDRTDRTLELPKSRFVECTLGLENGNWVVYVSWMSM